MMFVDFNQVDIFNSPILIQILTGWGVLIQICLPLLMINLQIFLFSRFQLLRLLLFNTNFHLLLFDTNFSLILHLQIEETY
jgi:hypothetical protein